MSEPTGVEKNGLTLRSNSSAATRKSASGGDKRACRRRHDAGAGRHRVQWSKAEEAFEMQCDTCLGFLPVTTEFWVPKHGLTRCRACYRESNNVRQARKNGARRADPGYRLIEAEALRIKRGANRDAWLEYRRAYYRANRDHLCAMRRARYAATKETAA